MRIRLLIDSPASGAWNMAVDEAILRTASVRQDMLTVRLYMWERPTISAGYFSKLTDDLLDKCKSRGVDVVRRLSGGGIVLHDDEVTYSVVLPRQLIGDSSVFSVCEFVSRGVIIGLSKLGIEAHLACDNSTCKNGQAENAGCNTSVNRVDVGFCYAMCSPTDIVVDSRKLIGSAQARCNGAILQHGSVPLSWNRELLHCLFGDGILEGRGFASLEEVLRCKPSAEDVVGALRVGFEGAFGQRLHADELSDEEVDLAFRLSDRKWILRCS